MTQLHFGVKQLKLRVFYVHLYRTTYNRLTWRVFAKTVTFNYFTTSTGRRYDLTISENQCSRTQVKLPTTLYKDTPSIVHLNNYYLCVI